LIRFLTADDPAQFAVARRFVAENEVFVPVTVLLEAEWVLRRTYGFGAKRIAAELRQLSALPSVILEDSEGVARALDMVELGLDFADALHLTRSNDCADFATFDATMARFAGDVSPPITLLTSDR
jgi:predicted nucleic acid-binding protein